MSVVNPAVNPVVDRLQSLAGCLDTASVRSALIQLCTEFGKVTRIDVFALGEAEKRRAFCLVRLDSPAQQRELRAVLGAACFGEDVLILVDLPDAKASLPPTSPVL